MADTEKEDSDCLKSNNCDVTGEFFHPKTLEKCDDDEVQTGLKRS